LLVGGKKGLGEGTPGKWRTDIPKPSIFTKSKKSGWKDFQGFLSKRGTAGERGLINGGKSKRRQPDKSATAAQKPKGCWG